MVPSDGLCVRLQACRLLRVWEFSSLSILLVDGSRDRSSKRPWVMVVSGACSETLFVSAFKDRPPFFAACGVSSPVFGQRTGLTPWCTSNSVWLAALGLEAAANRSTINHLVRWWELQ